MTTATKRRSQAAKPASCDYTSFLSGKRHTTGDFGFSPSFMPSVLFDFQKHLVEWSVRKGRAAIFADCGLGKTGMALVWAENVARHTDKPVLVLTPLSVAPQFVREGAKFGVGAFHSRDGSFGGERVVVTNYERLHYFDADDFSGVVCDESSCLKNYDGVRTAAITEFMRTRPYRLLCSATPAPNDFVEIGTSSESLGEMGYMDMLSRFFKNDQNSSHPNRLWAGDGKWRFRGHAEPEFWRWMCSWARAIRRPSDLGFDDTRFVLPPLETVEHVVPSAWSYPGELYPRPAASVEEVREERKRTLTQRCDKVAELVSDTGKPAIVWCHLNTEGNRLTKLINGAEQVSGSDSDERKEEVFDAFVTGQVRVLVTKPAMAAWGLNFQHCSHQTYFPSHSYEQWFQGIRRSLRFGQKSTVRVDMVTSEGESGVLATLKRKAEQADVMFSRLVAAMGNELRIERSEQVNNAKEVPAWLS
jgi:hypothetical protein